MIQTDLQFENREPIAAKADPPSSHEAAERLTESGARSSQKALVLERLRKTVKWRGGNSVTSAELADDWQMDRYMVGRRLPDLYSDGFVERCPARRCEVAGTSAVTWRAKQ